MSPSGTTESDRDIGFPLRLIARQQGCEQMLDLTDCILIGRIVRNILRDFIGKPGQWPQAGIPVRVAQETHVEHQIGVARHAPRKTE